MGKKETGSRKPFSYNLSMPCNIINQAVNIQYEELMDGWPLKILWKKLVSCNCNSQCNPSNPNIPPNGCPALKRQIVKSI